MMTAGRIRGSGIRGGISLVVLFVAFSGGLSRAQEAPRPASFYIDAALSGNPSLSAMRERIRAKENAAIRAGAFDDPKLWIGIVNVPVTSWSFHEEDMTGKEIGLSQMFPYPGKRKLRTEIAAREKEQIESDLQEMRNMLRTEIKMAYAEISYLRRQAGDVARSREILRDVVAVSQEMYSVGKVTQSDVHRGQVEFEKMREMLLVLENREKVLSIRLNTLSALPPDQPVPALDNQGEFEFPLGGEELIALYKAERPARKALEARIRRGDTAIAMAERDYYPDFEVSASYMQRDAMPDGTSRPDMVSAMVSVNLPIWRRAKLAPAVREMTAEREMSRNDLATLDLEASNAIGNALSSMDNRRRLAALYRTTIIPHAETAFQATLAGYRVAKVDFPTLMDSITNLLVFRRDYSEMVGELHVQKAKLEAAIGTELGGEGR